MFIKREKYEDILEDLKRQRREIDKLECEVMSLKDKNKKLMNELDEELTENREQHKKLLGISKAMERPFGTYTDIYKTRNDIKKILSTN